MQKYVYSSVKFSHPPPPPSIEKKKNSHRRDFHPLLLKIFSFIFLTGRGPFNSPTPVYYIFVNLTMKKSTDHDLEGKRYYADINLFITKKNEAVVYDDETYAPAGNLYGIIFKLSCQSENEDKFFFSSNLLKT